MKAETDLVYWVLTALPLVLLTALLVPLVPRAGVWFFTTPTRDQWVTLGLFAFTVGLALFGVQRPAFAIFMALTAAAVLFQSWGPKRWSGGRVYGAYLVPLKIRGWSEDGGKVAIRLTWGCRISVADTPTNAGFLADLKAHWVKGEGLD